MNLSQLLPEISFTPIINPTTVKYIVIKLDLAVDLGFFLLTCIKVKKIRRKFYFFNARLEVY